MPNPKDYGDPYPSDIGDVPPINPTTGFSETNFKLNTASITGKSAKMRRSPTQENPDLGHRDIQKPPRTTYTGIIVAKTPDRNAWVVLRQDGKRIVAYIRAADGVYDNLRPGEHVTLGVGQLGKNQWLITGSPRRDELSTITVYNTEEQGPSNTLIRVNLDAIEKQTGETTIFNQVAGGVEVNKREWGLFEIHWKVTTVCVNPDDFKAPVRVEAKCDLSEPTKYSLITSESIIFNRDSGFNLSRFVEDDGTIKAMISMAVRSPYMMPFSDEGDGNITWTNAPIVGHSIEAGRKVPQGWVKITSNGGGYIWLGHGNAKLKMRFPDTFPFTGSHLVVSGESGECVQTKWSNPGGNGYITIYCCYDGELIGRWKVEDGLIVSGPGIIPTSSQDGVPVTCNVVPSQIWSCTSDDVTNPPAN